VSLVTTFALGRIVTGNNVDALTLVERRREHFWVFCVQHRDSVCVIARFSYDSGVLLVSECHWQQNKIVTVSERVTVARVEGTLGLPVRLSRGSSLPKMIMRTERKKLHSNPYYRWRGTCLHY